MGIHGLMSYVGEHKQFFTDLQLRNTKIIIDGNNLFHRLYFESNLDLQHGGDYDSFTDIVHKFFETLSVCKIYPYVVLDGGCDLSDKKFVTLKERARDKIQVAYSISRGGGGSVLPLLTREVFKQALTKLEVPFVQCFSEADRDIVSLANHWNCPVLTLDSDFCIFDLKAGYCPLNYFQWRNLCTCEGTLDCYIPARCFSLERLCSHFSHMNKALLPLFAVMNGNDYINLPALETFFSKVRLPVGGSGWSGRKHVRIQGLLNWLSRFADPTEAIANVLKYLKKHEREEIRELLCASMEEYEESDVNLEDFFQNGNFDSQVTRKLELPQWMLEALAKGHLSPFISDALLLRRTILHVQVENMQRPSAHTVALPIRQVIYGLLLNASQNSEVTSPSKQSNKLPIVREFDRSQKTLKKSFVPTTMLPRDFCEDHRPLATLTEVPRSDRLKLLLETLGVKASILQPIPSPLWLPVAVTCYWMRYSEPKVKLHHLQALLLGMVFGELHKTTTSSPDPAVFHVKDKMIYDQFLKWKEKNFQKLLDLDTAHTFCQWQCCLQMGLHLNQLLSTPLPEPDLTRLYCGTLVHRLCKELKSAHGAENLLISSPKMSQLYCDLLHAVKSTVPPDFFQETTKTTKSCKEKNKQATSQAETTRQHATLEAQPFCDVNNRFASLMVED
ncbi:protein asteroid homolog 1 isoform X2 [Mauremys reevesii]|uniref:protein asteroid homolog 1 isoform X2 n=1 Tax=Mauremys reevesii TaxID=260615 RepID=UPI00193F0981|nr:protein asteroid homolog 1 isoform X2 [Mauremys reevesii]